MKASSARTANVGATVETGEILSLVVAEHLRVPAVAVREEALPSLVQEEAVLVRGREALPALVREEAAATRAELGSVEEEVEQVEVHLLNIIIHSNSHHFLPFPVMFPPSYISV